MGQSGSQATQRCMCGRKVEEHRMQRVEGMCGGWGRRWTGGLSRRARCVKGQRVGVEHRDGFN